MAAAILTQGLTTIRTAAAASFSPYIGLSDDTTAFAAAQTTLNPAGGTTVTLIQSATIAIVSTTSYTATVTVTGSSQLTGKVINTVGACTGTAATTAQSRTVRGSGLGIGVQSGDVYTIGLQITVADNS